MKYLVVFSCLLVTVYGLPPEIVEHIRQQIMEFGKECMSQTPISGEEMALLKKHELPSTHDGKCFIACMHKQFGFQDKSGKIDKAESYAMLEKLKPLDEELYGKMKIACDNCHAKVTDSADECETAYNMMACFTAEHKALGIKTFEMD